jgi:hypothetical protein
MLGFVSAHIPWNTITNREFRRAYNALRPDLQLPGRSTLSNICRREYARTIEAIREQLPKSNKISLAIDGWTSTNKLAITSVIGYYIARDWTLKEVQLAFDEVNMASACILQVILLISTLGEWKSHRCPVSRASEGGS